MKTKTILALVFAGLFTVTASAALTGVTINGTALNDAAGSSGAGWTYTPPTLTLSGAGPFTLAGTNTAAAVRVVVQEGVTCTVTLAITNAPGDDAGALMATGGDGGTGQQIAGSAGAALTVSGGTLFATGGAGGAPASATWRKAKPATCRTPPAPAPSTAAPSASPAATRQPRPPTTPRASGA